MKSIELSQGRFAQVDDCDFELFNRFSWFLSVPGRSPNLAYAVRKIRLPSGGYSKVLLHREIMGNPIGQEVDHIDHDGLNNQRTNLRLASPSQNQANSRHHADAYHSRYKGVTKHKKTGLWQVSCQKDKKRHYLCGFADEDTAGRAYDQLAYRLHGDFSNPNFK